MKRREESRSCLPYYDLKVKNESFFHHQNQMEFPLPTCLALPYLFFQFVFYRKCPSVK